MLTGTYLFEIDLWREIMIRSRFALILAFMTCIISTNALGADFFGNKQRELQVDILILEATLDLSHYAASVGAAWARESRKGPEDLTQFERDGSISAYLASGWAAVREATQNAAEMVSRKGKDPWWCDGTNAGICQWASVISGKTEAERVASSFSRKIWNQTTEIASKSANTGADGAIVGRVAAQAAWNLVSQVENEIARSIRKEVTSRILAKNVNFEEILTALKRPIGTADFRKALPEIQAYYERRVGEIELKMREL
jgi:hypothetical protein